MQGQSRLPVHGDILCDLSEITDPGAKGFVFGSDILRLELFLVRRGDDVFAYVNACPHAGTPLDVIGDRFLNRAGTRIVCATHGAQFRISDGFCLSGPCKGKSLSAVEVKVVDDAVRLAGPVNTNANS